MPNSLQRNIVLPLLSIMVAMLMVQCSGQSAPVHRANGLTCQSHSSSTDGGLNVTTETDCSFKCPDGRLLSLPAAVQSQTKDELNFEFCGVPFLAGGGADVAANQTPGTAAPTAPATPIPLLNGQVDLCDPLRGIINFILAQPPQNLTGKKLVVEIQGQQTPCSIDPAFPGELSCKLPPHTTWPAGIIVRVNDQAVNLFPYTGANCELKAGARAVLTEQAAGHASPTPIPSTPVAPTQIPPTHVPPTVQPPTQVPPTQQPPTSVPPTAIPPTSVPPTLPPPTQVQPTPIPPTQPAPTSAPAPTQPAPAATQPPVPTEGGMEILLDMAI
jgi:hypothetical protein